MTAAQSPPKLITLILITAASMLSLNMFMPSLTHMADDFGVSYGIMNISVSGYLAVTAVLQIIMGPLSDRYGRRPVLLGSAVVFCAASIGCIFATNIWTFLVFRILQGAIISGTALARAVVRDMMEPEDAVKVLGTIAMAMAVAPMFGPMLGGVLDGLFGWRFVFWVYLAMGLAFFALVWVDVGETNLNPSETFGKQFATYPELIGSGRFWGYAICLAFGVACYFAFLSGAPLIANEVLKVPSSHLGFYMGSITMGFFGGSFVSSRLIGRLGLTRLILLGRFVAVIGLAVGLAIVLSGTITAASIFGATIFIGIGNGLTLPSCNVGVMSVRADLAGSASGLSGALAVGIGAILATIMGAVLTPENAAWGFLTFLFVVKIISLLAGLYVHRLETKST
jgi:Bcr/CflA subfamily drug resistance transporter